MANIKALTVDTTTFVRPDGFDLPRFWAVEAARFEASLRPLIARVRLTTRGLTRLATQGAYAVRAIDAARPDERDGWSLVDVPIESLDQGAALLLGLTPDVETLDPPELRALVCERARSAVDRHSAVD